VTSCGISVIVIIAYQVSRRKSHLPRNQLHVTGEGHSIACTVEMQAVKRLSFIYCFSSLRVNLYVYL